MILSEHDKTNVLSMSTSVILYSVIRKFIFNFAAQAIINTLCKKKPDGHKNLVSPHLKGHALDSTNE